MENRIPRQTCQPTAVVPERVIPIPVPSFVETALTTREVEATVELEIRTGFRTPGCCFLDD